MPSMPAQFICAMASLIVVLAFAGISAWHTWLVGLVLKSCTFSETITRTPLAWAVLTKFVMVVE